MSCRRRASSRSSGSPSTAPRWAAKAAERRFDGQDLNSPKDLTSIFQIVKRHLEPFAKA